MTILQLNPQIPLVTPMGGAQCVAIIDCSEEHDLKFVCVLDEGGAIFTFQNKDVKGYANPTMGRTKQEGKPALPGPIADAVNDWLKKKKQEGKPALPGPIAKAVNTWLKKKQEEAEAAFAPIVASQKIFNDERRIADAARDAARDAEVRAARERHEARLSVVPGVREPAS